MLPRVIVHSASSVDGRSDWFAGDAPLYYEIARAWDTDAVMIGSNTVIEAYPPPGPDEPGPARYNPPDPPPLLVAVDGPGRLRHLHRIAREPDWRGVVALCSQAAPREYRDYLDAHGIGCIAAGADHVDLEHALRELAARYGVRAIRTDTGGALTGALFRAGLVDEVSVMVIPTLVGGVTPRGIYTAPDLASEAGVQRVRLLGVERRRGDTVWLRYAIDR